MKREWKPGDVALIEVGCHANRHVGMFSADGDGWRYGDDGWVRNDPAVVTARPLITIDPENPEQVERLWKAWRDLAPDHRLVTRGNLIAALHEFANPTPPKPEEPTGLGAVVEDADGSLLIRNAPTGDRPWVTCHGATFAWREIDPVATHSDGWTA